ncbi:MAG: RelA/SpoT domain-containing protein [Kangiellaceae bacterium]|nr:RelA/SpoT domain-containing protein [Kangiellaceae bacterium]
MEDIKFESLQISTAASTAESRLLDILKTAKLQDICYAYKTRVKPWSKLIQKVEIKRESKPDYTIDKITDVLGLRIVTLFRQDMSKVVGTILSLISHKLPYNPIPFVKNDLKEAIIYTPDIGNDPVVSQVIQEIKTFELMPEEEIQENGSAARYSSIHLVAFIDQSVDEFDQNYRIPIEIQIRTVFEDAWGEIDHQYGYQNRTGKTDEPIQHPELVGKNLLTLKKFVDSCAEYADNIRDLAVQPIHQRQTITTLVTDKIVESNLLEAKVSQLVIDQYKTIRQQRAKAENANNSEQTFINAAEGFKYLYAQIKEGKLIRTPEGRKRFRYYIKMDEALCRLSINIHQETISAISIYKDLVSEYPAFPIIHFRLGQAYLEISKFEDSRKHLKKCSDSVATLSKLKEKDRLISLPDVELNKLGVAIHILFGLAYWKEADEIYSVNPASLKVKQYLEQAYIKTKDGLQIDGLMEDYETKLINNLLFYSLEIEHFKKVSGKNKEYMLAIPKHLKSLEPRIEISKCKNIAQLDTLMSSYTYIGQIEQAKTIAYRIEKLVVESQLWGKLTEPSVLSRVNSLLGNGD